MRFRLILLATAAVLAPASGSFAQTTPATDPAPAEPAADSAAEKSSDATTVETVTVTADANAVRTDIDRKSYSLAGDLQATTGSLADALRGVPGVQVDVQGNVSLRGNEGVTILVDGKPSGLFNGEGRGDALLQMPADQIERVEVMTNPSAAFSPEGTGGIINLVTKKNRRAMRSATVRANVGTDGRYNGGVSGSYRGGKITLSGDLGLRHNENEGGYDQYRERFDIGSGLFLPSRQESDSVSTSDAVSARGSLDYDPDDKTRFSLELRYRGWMSDSRSTDSYEAEDALGALASAYARGSAGDTSAANLGATGRYRRQFAGDQHDVSLELSAERNERENDVAARLDYAVPVLPSLYERIGGETTTERLRFSTDYNRPLEDNARLKLGFELTDESNDYDNFGERGPAPGATLPVPALTNRFLYDQKLAAAYVTYQRPIGPVTAQFGLRVEAVQIDLEQITAGIQAANNYAGVYPTLHLAYDLTEKQQLTASYSRRIQRPWAGDLNPYVVYVDLFNLRSGNPDLEPEITDSVEAGWQYRGNGAFYTASVYYRQSSDGVTDVTRDIGGGVFLTTKENVAESRSGGLELSANGKFHPKLSYNLNADLSWNEIDSALTGLGGTRSDVSWFGFGSLNWQATPKDFVQLSGWAFGDRITAQGYYKGGGGLNLGYRRKLTDDVSFVLTAQDILDTARFEEVIDTPQLRGRSVYEHSARSLYVGFSWTLGNAPRRPDAPNFEFENSGGGAGR